MWSERFGTSACLALGLFLLGLPAYGQVVQLPTFHTFSVGTTVVVPDRGGVFLGGINRARFGSTEFGVPGMAGIPGAGRLFGNRAIGGEVGTSQVNATATILDLQELDRGVRAQAARAQTAEPAPAPHPAIARKAAFLAQHIGRNDVRGGVAPAARPATPTATATDAETQARAAYEIAQQAEARGQLATARVNYKRAASLSRGKLRTDALARLSSITPMTPHPSSTKR